MAATKGRRVAMRAGVAAIIVVLAMGAAFHGRVIDRYYLWKLRSSSGEEWDRYLDRLMDRRCPAVVPDLLRYCDDPRNQSTSGHNIALMNDCADKIISLGPGAVPYLAQALEGRIRDLHAVYPQFSYQVVYRSLRGLMDHAKSAIPALVRDLEAALSEGRSAQSDWEVQVAFTAILAHRADDVLPRLVRLKPKTDEYTRFYVYWVVGMISPKPSPYTPMLLEAMRTEPAYVRVAAAGALARVGEDNPEVFTVLRAGLRDDDKWARAGASVYLGELGWRARPALEELQRLMEGDSSDDVRSAAAEALKKIEASHADSPR